MAAADLPVLSLADVARHSTPACCWVAIDGRVYDVTAFVEKHPGGKAVLLGVGGRDASKQFKMFHKPEVLARYKQLCVGVIGAAPAAAASRSGDLGAAAPAAAASRSGDLGAVRAAIAALLEEDVSRGPFFIRLAWHAAGTYDAASGGGGSNGATMRFEPEAGCPANAGLGGARELLARVHAAHPWASRADMWQLAAVVAIRAMGGPAVPFTPGRTDAASGAACPPVNRLPDADKGSDAATAAHVRAVFGRMGFSDQETVALLGAHATGACHRDRSGYDGPWTHTPHTFNNAFYTTLLETRWKKRTWDGPEQYIEPSGKLMMLPADMVLLRDAGFRRWVEVYAADGARFARDFAAAFAMLQNNGVPRARM